MVFRYYSNAISQASKNLARWIFIVGLFLIGFGIVIIALPELFAILAAMVFFVAGLGCAGTAVKIFLAQRKIDKIHRKQSGDYRENVQIHIEEDLDI